MLTIEEKEVVLEILKLNVQLLSLYKDFDKYKDEIVNIENNILYILSNLNIRKYKEIYEYLDNIYPFLEPSLIDDLIYDDDISLIMKKTINMIRDYIINKTSNGFNTNYNLSLFNNTYDDSFMEMNKNYHIKNYILKDLYKIFIEDIDFRSTNEDNIDIKEVLINSKNVLLYINSSFDITSDNEYLSSSIISNFNGISIEKYEKVKEEFISSIIKKHLEYYSTYSDNDLDNEIYKLEIELILSLISSCITLLEEETVNEILNYYNNNLLEEDDNYKQDILNDKLYLLFNNIKEVKSKYKVLSLRIN